MAKFKVWFLIKISLYTATLLQDLFQNFGLIKLKLAKVSQYKVTLRGQYTRFSPRKISENLWLSDILIGNKQGLKQPVRKGVLRNFAKFSGKYQRQSHFFNRVACLRPATLLKKRLWHKCFPVNFATFLGVLSYRTPLGDCFCKEHWPEMDYYLQANPNLRIASGQNVKRMLYFFIIIA